MKIDTVVRAMQDQPWGITVQQGSLLYDFVLREKPREILELGAGIGTSACYMCAALEELGAGRVTSIDCNPDLPEWINRTFAKADSQLSRFHDLNISPDGYNVVMMKAIESATRRGVCHPPYDFCFLDGAHTWDVDGLAFFLAAKLLKPGGWLLLDDLGWTLAGSDEAKKHGIQANPELAATAQVTKVFNLLVKQHPDFADFITVDDWGWARKRNTTVRQDASNVVELYKKHGFLKRTRSLLGKMKRAASSH